VSAWVGDAINACNPVTVTVTRYLAPVVTAGRRQDLVVDTTFSMIASIQPLTQQELQLLPEGMRTQGRVKVYTQTELFTLKQATAIPPDRFSYGGVDYLVERKDDWEDYGDYFKFIAVRVNR
jgi:hypothetical protein